MLRRIKLQMQRIIEGQNKVVITDRMWARVLSSTNQPSFTVSKNNAEEKTGDEPNGEQQQQ